MNMNSISLWTLTLSAIGSISDCNSARILVVFPLPSASHSAVLHTITEELARRGHELEVFDAYPLGEKVANLENYHEHYLHDNTVTYEVLRKYLKQKVHPLQLMTWLPATAESLMKNTFSHKEMARLIARDSKETFDLIVIEWIAWDALNALGYRFNAPVIGLISVPISMFGFTMGLPFSSIDIPPYITGHMGEKNFADRLKGIFMDLGLPAFHHYNLYRQQKIVEEFFGHDYPHVHDLMKNVSMIFTDQDAVMPYPTIGAPNVINIGGIHVSRETDQQLPGDVKNFLDRAEKGFIYFSLGSTLPSHFLPDEKREIFMAAFAELPYRVIWKWAGELPGKPDNVFISDWLPQRAVLAHPGIKAFLYQGGLQSTEEAIAAAVPLVGFPIFGDQQSNMGKMLHIGGAIQLDIHNLSKDGLKQAIMEVAENGQYKARMLDFRSLMNDRPHDPINHTMWWIEYVIRHKGAHHLKLARSVYPWYQAQNLDVLAFCIVSIITFTTILLFTIYKVIRLMVRCCRVKDKMLKSKQS